MPTTTLTLRRPEKPGGIERVTVTYNGNVQVAGTKGRVLSKRRFLFEMQRARSLSAPTANRR